MTDKIAEIEKRRIVAVTLMGLDLENMSSWEAADAILSALGQGWQDISSAPKDGTRIDVWVPGIIERSPNTFWNKREGVWESHTGLYFTDPAPTHWMPLPSPPTQEAK